MHHVTDALSTMRRPPILMRAARHGLNLYARDKDLKRILRKERLPAPETMMSELLELEGVLNDQRLSGLVTYSVARHVEVLVALLSEAQRLGLMPRRASPVASAPQTAPAPEVCKAS